jgi:glycosyltransferase involved in cell wall biosynthesis
MISVIMPVYNAEKYLKESIESILSQTESFFEFIIINDGSTDRSAEIITSYDDDRIVYVYQENQGEAAARNKGLALAKGDYIVWQDADDISLPNRLNRLKQTIEQSEEIGYVHSDMLLINENGSPIGYWQSQNISKDRVSSFLLKVGTPFNNPSMIIRKQILGQSTYDVDLKIGTDTDMISKIFNGRLSVHINEPLLLYRRHGNNLSATGNYDDHFQHVTKFLERNQLVNLFPEINWSSDKNQDNEAKALVLLSLFLFRRGMFVHSNYYLNEAKKIQVSSDCEKFIIAIANLILKKYEDAVYFLSCIPNKDHIEENYLGEAYAYLGNYIEAKYQFIKAVSLSPDYFEPVGNLKSIGGAVGLNLIDNSWRKFIN